MLFFLTVYYWGLNKSKMDFFPFSFLSEMCLEMQAQALFSFYNEQQFFVLLKDF